MGANTAVCCLILGSGLIARVVSDAEGGTFLRYRWTPLILGGLAMLFTLLIWNAVRAIRRESAARVAGRGEPDSGSTPAGGGEFTARWHGWGSAGRGPAVHGSEWERDAESYLRDYPG
jgi:hypothetical protein